jgi:hypothetical protein
VPAAILLVVPLDTTQWIITCVVMAGPMLMSGLLETLLDSRLLNYLEKSGSLSPRKVAHLLLSILIVNLDEDLAWRHSKRFVGMLDDGEIDKKEVNETKALVDLQENQTIPDIAIVPASLNFQQQPEPNQSDDCQSQRSAGARLYIGITKSWLVSLLESQVAFGSSVGIGVIFFVASFFYSVSQIETVYGGA